MADEADLFNKTSGEDETCPECGELLEDCECDPDEECAGCGELLGNCSCDEEEEDEDAE